MTKEIISIKQLPIIEQHLKQIKSHMIEQSEKALALECTSTTVKDIKKVRATLTAEFNELEAKRKEVKSQVLAPYDEFEAIYKECVTNVYRQTENVLKSRIGEVERELLAKKEKEVIEYFEEYKELTSTQFVKLEDLPIKINLSTSLKKIKEQCKELIDNIVHDIELINTYMDSAEIFYEYKQNYNVSKSVAIVLERKKIIEQREQQQEQEQQRKKAEEERQEKIIKEVAPVVVEVPQPIKEEPQEQQLYKVSFEVTGTIEELRKLKAFLKSEGMNYESK